MRSPLPEGVHARVPRPPRQDSRRACRHGDAARSHLLRRRQTKATPVDLIGFDNPPDGTHGEGSVRAAETLRGRAEATAPAAGLGFVGHSYSFGASGTYDDLVIDTKRVGCLR